jgi:hypothetical protein
MKQVGRVPYEIEYIFRFFSVLNGFTICESDKNVQMQK